MKQKISTSKPTIPVSKSNPKIKKIKSKLKFKKVHDINILGKFFVRIECDNSIYGVIDTYLCNLYIKQNDVNQINDNVDLSSPFTDTDKSDTVKPDANQPDTVKLDPNRDHGFTELQVSFITSANIDTQKEVRYTLPKNKLLSIKYENHIIQCIIINTSSAHGTNYAVKKMHEMIIIADTKAIIDKLIISAHKEKKNLHVNHYNMDGYWQIHTKIQKREESSLIIKENDKKSFIEDITKFIKSSAEYDHYGIPYKRNYLFYGKPGTGKTSLVNVIANKFDRNINVISFSVDLTDEDLYRAISIINGSTSILLLEDIDCIFQDRQTDSNKSRVSFSALLNVLDGVTNIKGLITIITTNYVKELDKALLRPGRIDMMIEFTIINREQIEGFLAFYKITLDQKTVSELVKLSQKCELTPAIFSEFLFRNRDISLDSSNYLEIFKKYLEEIEVSLVDNNYQTMFS